MSEHPQSYADGDLYAGYEPEVRINPQLPSDYLLLSTAARRLGEGMWGGLRRPDAVREFLSSKDAAVLGFRRSSAGFATREEDTAECFWGAARDGTLPIYVVGPPDEVFGRPSPPTEPLRVPVAVLHRLVSPLRISDHAIRPTLKACGGDPVLLARLCRGTLAVRESEFDRWYRAERSRRTWPSQRGSRRKSGRPSKRTGALDAAILDCVRDGRWTGKEPLSTLLHLLLADGFRPLSADTLCRIVDQLHAERGDRLLARRRRRARTPTNTPITAK